MASMASTASMVGMVSMAGMVTWRERRVLGHDVGSHVDKRERPTDGDDKGACLRVERVGVVAITGAGN